MNVTHGLIFRKVSRTIPGRLQSDWVRCREPSLQASQDCTGPRPLSAATRGHPALSRTPFPSYARAPSPIKDPFPPATRGHPAPSKTPFSIYQWATSPTEDLTAASPFTELSIKFRKDHPLFQLKETPNNKLTVHPLFCIFIIPTLRFILYN